MPLPDGYRQVRGNRSRIITPTGETITRGQAETLFAQQYGFRSDYDRRQWSRKVRGSGHYSDQVIKARESGRASSKHFNANAARLVRERREGRVDKSPGGTLATHLYLLGHIDEPIIPEIPGY